jgi:flagellar protein FlaJ
MKINKEKIKELASKSILEEYLKKEAYIQEKEFKNHKQRSVTLSVFAGLMSWFCIGLYVKDILLSLAISIIISIVILILLLQQPLVKRKKLSKKIEAQLPMFLTKLIFQLRAGKSFFNALEDLTSQKKEIKKEVETEFEKVITDTRKGCSLQEALERMNRRLCSISVKRTTSNIYAIYTNGSGESVGLKKLVDEMLLKQKIESKEFSGKMVVYALVFIAISAIVPAMFQSFMLVGSYFMKIQITAISAFAITTLLFPLIDIAILLVIDSKTPLFLKGVE